LSCRKIHIPYSNVNNYFSLLQQNFGHFNIETKLVGQTYDGAAVMAGELNGLQKKIKSIAPQALFTLLRP
jgi:hypothetical protein